NPGHRHFADLDFVSVGPRFLLGHADASQLRICEDAVGYDALVDSAACAFDQVGVNDLEIVVRDVSEGGPAFHVAKCPDTGNARFQFVVDPDCAIGIEYNSGLVKIQFLGIGSPSSRNENM